MDIKEVKNETIETVIEYLKQLDSGIVDCVESLRQGNDRKGMGLLTMIIDGLNWSIEAISLSVDSLSNPIAVEEISGIIKEMMSAMENNDNVLLSDMLEYEISPLINEWSEKLQKE